MGLPVPITPFCGAKLSSDAGMTSAPLFAVAVGKTIRPVIHAQETRSPTELIAA